MKWKWKWNWKWITITPVFVILFIADARPVAPSPSPSEKLKPLDINAKFQKEMMALKELPPKKFLKEINDIRQQVEKIFGYKQRSCQGEFIVTVWSEAGETEVVEKKRLTRRERGLCYQEMKSYRAKYINEMFEARKKFLNFAHEKRLESLEIVKAKSLKRLGKGVTTKK